MVALPAVAEPSKVTVPLLVMAELAAVVLLWKFSVAPAALLIVAVPAEALVKKSIWPLRLLVMLALPAELKSSNVTKLLLVSVAVPAVLFWMKLTVPPASFVMVTAPMPPLAVLLFWKTRLLPEVTSNVCVLPELLMMPVALMMNGLTSVNE